MSAHLLPLSALHAAAPGVLDVVFGPDGEFEGAPHWRGPLVSCGETVYFSRPFDDGVFVHCLYGCRMWRRLSDVVLDCRVHSVFAHMLRLCKRASNTLETINEAHDLLDCLVAYMIGMVPWTDEHAARLAALTLTLAPRIAALGGSK